MQLTCTAWVESINSRDGGWGKTYSFCQKHRSLSLQDLLWKCRYLLRISFVTNPKSSLCTALTTQNTTENNSIILQAQNAIALQLSLFLTGIYQLLDTNKRRSALPSENNCQGRLQTPQSLTVPNGHLSYISPFSAVSNLAPGLKNSLASAGNRTATPSYPHSNCWPIFALGELFSFSRHKIP
jgi:hypothetical protein